MKRGEATFDEVFCESWFANPELYGRDPGAAWHSDLPGDLHPTNRLAEAWIVHRFICILSQDMFRPRITRRSPGAPP